MSPRVAALLELVTRAAQQQIGLTFAATRVNAFEGDYELRLIGDTPPFPSDNRYELYVYPAISELTVLAGCRMLQYTFVVFRPMGDVMQRRDDEERARAVGAPNRTFVEICRDLDPHAPEMRWIIGELAKDLPKFWPHRTFCFLAGATSAELEVCMVFADVESFKQVALDAGRRTAA